MNVYVDTSALAKWYVNEPFSEEFESFINQIGQGLIARLTVVEFRCLLARKRRAAVIDSRHENSAFRAFQTDAKDGFWRIEPLHDAHLISALDLLERLKAVPLRTLDAIHLAAAKTMKASLLATADKIIADAAALIELETRNFF
jgi:predicted nucleic acid-binding protein